MIFGKTLPMKYLNYFSTLQRKRVRTSPGIFEYIMGPSKLAPYLQDFLRVKRDVRPDKFCKIRHNSIPKHFFL